MQLAAQAILDLAAIYLLLGVIGAVGFVTVGIARVVPHFGHVTPGARVMILPAAILLWPLLARRWLAAR